MPFESAGQVSASDGGLERGYHLWIDGRGYGQFARLDEVFEVLDRHHRDCGGGGDRYFLWEIEDYEKGFDVAPVRRAAERMPVIAWLSYDWDAAHFKIWLDAFGWDRSSSRY